MRRQPKQYAAALQSLEPRRMLTTYVVDSPADESDLAVAGVADGQLTLREAVTAANRDAAFGDAPAGSGADTITFAPELAGGTIELDGQTLTVTRDLTVDGGDGHITLQPEGGFINRTRLFNIQTSGEVTLRNLDIRGGNAGGNGKAVLIGGDSRVRLEDVSVAGTINAFAVLFEGERLDVVDSLFRDLRGAVSIAGGEASFADTLFAAGGTAIAVDGGDVSVLRSEFIENLSSIEVDAGSVLVEESSFVLSSSAMSVAAGAEAVVRESSFRDNGSLRRSVFTTIPVSGGGAIDNAGLVTVEGGVFSNNVGHQGGAIRNTGELTVSDAEFLDNAARRQLNFDDRLGHGGAIYSAGPASLTDVVFRGNSADRDGGAVHVAAGELRAARARFEGNRAAGQGGGVAVRANATGRLPASEFVGNTARFGGGVHNRGLSVVFETNFSGNFALVNGGGLHQVDDGSRAVTLIRGGSIEDNHAGLAGGGVSAAGGVLQLDSGVSVGTVRFDGFGDGNTAQNGGGIAALPGETLTRLRVTNADVEANIASGNGGGLYVAEGQSAELKDVRMSRNLASESGGGVFSAAASNVDLFDVDISENLARRSGGGVAARGRLTVEGTRIFDNTGSASGGGVFLSVGSQFRVVGDGSFVNRNTSAGPGGGLFNAGTAMLGTLSVRSNRGSDGGGIFTAFPGRTELEESEVQSNTRNNLDGPGTVV